MGLKLSGGEQVARTQVILVTGATDGRKDAAWRSPARSSASRSSSTGATARIASTLDEVRRAGTGEARGYRADLSSLEEVRELAAAVTAGEPRLDVLLDNAGIGTRVPSRPRAGVRRGRPAKAPGALRAPRRADHCVMNATSSTEMSNAAPGFIVNWIS